MKAGQEEETGEHFAKFFPTLVWAVRDHHLQLVVDGNNITADQYLENCLVMKKSSGKKINDYNCLRQTIQDLFKERKCFVFPLPTAMNNLQNLDTMKMEELDPEFVEVGEKFSEFVRMNGSCKMVNGKEITGGMYLTLTEKYVEAIVTGNINIESAYDSMMQAENTKSHHQAAVKFYTTEMESIHTKS